MNTSKMSQRRRPMSDLYDLNMIEAMRDNINTTMTDYMRKEHENLTKARNATSDESKELYLAEAARYRSYINDIIECRNYITEQANRIRELRAGRQSPHRNNTSANNTMPQAQNVQSSTQPLIASSTPIQIPSTFANTDVPNEYMCPITMQIMTDPVILTDGHVYEKKAIEQWLTTHDTSPITKQTVNKNIIIPCFALRKLIEEFVTTSDKEGPKQPINPTKHIKKVPKTKTSSREPTKYNKFVQEMMPLLRQQYPEKAPKELMKIIGAQWKVQKI